MKYLSKESYKHRLAKEILYKWLTDEYLRVDLESKFILGYLKLMQKLY